MTRNWPLPWQNSQKEARPMKLDQVNHIPQRDGYGQGLLDLCAAREDVVVLDADVSASTRTNWVHDRYPDHFYNVGISEQDLVGTAAGLALGGQVPFVSTYGVFLSGRAFDQIRTTVCYNDLHVIFGGAHAGDLCGPRWSHPPGPRGPGPGPGPAPDDRGGPCDSEGDPEGRSGCRRPPPGRSTSVSAGKPCR